MTNNNRVPWYRKTYPRKQVLRVVIVYLVLALLAALGALCIGIKEARAFPTDYPGIHCVDDLWWTLQATRRVLCDGPMQPDGSWTRAREFYTPAHNVPLTCSTYGGSYYSSTSCSGGYWVPRQSEGIETYPVNPVIKLADEPGHIAS